MVSMKLTGFCAYHQNEGKGAPCGACRELMVQLMPGKYKEIDIMINYSKGIVMKLGDLTPEWWID